MLRIGVVLCGCGRFDGSEIHESVLTLLHLARHGAEALCFAPDRPQWAVCDHRTGEPREGERRNMLVEAARIARGNVQPLAEADAADLDGLILPGGSGAARNLADFKERGADATPLPELADLLRAVHAAGKPIGGICIAPALLALVFGAEHPRLTLGKSGRSAREATRAGAVMEPCSVDRILVDERHGFVTTPAYVLGPGIAEVDRGIGLLVEKVLALAAAKIRS